MILKYSLVQWFVYYLPEFQSKRWNDNEESETTSRGEILERIFWQLIDTIKENLPEDNEDKLEYARDDAYFILFLDSDIDMMPELNSNEYIADNIAQLIIDNYVASGNQERLSEVLGE